jgi:hypothetical protein
MSNLLQSGSAWLAAQQKTNASTLVTYQRGGAAGQTVQVSVAIGRTEQETVSNEGAIVETQTKDFLIVAADLVLSSIAVQPKAGDQIVWTDGSVYEVMDMGAGIGPWRWSDDYRIRYRIHTKQVNAQ